MMDAARALEVIVKAMLPNLQECGFTATDAPDELTVDATACFRNESGLLRLDLYESKAELRWADKDEEPIDADYSRISLSLLELADADERSVKYIGEDFAEDILKKFGSPRKRTAAGAAGTAQAKKLPKSVSKTAIKNGDAYYDAVSFGNSFTGIYPELRAQYKADYEKYGEFLAEDFFLNYGNAVVLQTLRSHSDAAMHKLFNLLNEVYENATNEVQSLIAVTILGQEGINERILADAVDYMSADLAPIVINVHKFFGTSAGRKALEKLKNPPLYKPKKQKRSGGFMNSLMNAQQQQQR
ncbi:MAG: hypothetical protein LBR73_09775 [Oscillospiraceae bacterium]|jgi:hypothetical protein|nr:hypothetical protein [Oscillospiraceae bacterium]